MNFTDALDRAAEDVKRPPNLPIGTYEWVIKKYETDTIADGEYDVLDFHMTCTGMKDDVDPDALAEYGNALGTTTRYRFMFNTDPEEKNRYDQSMFKLKRFLQDHVKCWDEGENLKTALYRCINQKVLGTIRWRADKTDPETQYAEIGKTAPIS